MIKHLLWRFHERVILGLRRNRPMAGPWFVALMLALPACGPTATERAVAQLRQIGSECQANAARIAEEATSREEGLRLLADEINRCTALACGYCDEHGINCADHGATCNGGAP